MPFNLSKSVLPSPLLKNFVLTPCQSFVGFRASATLRFIRNDWTSRHKKAWSPALSLASHPEALGIALQVEASNVEAPRRYDITNHYTDSSIGVRIHQWLSRDSGHVYSTPTGHLPLPCFWLTFWNFPTIPRCQNQSVVNAFHYVCSTREHAKLKNIKQKRKDFPENMLPIGCKKYL